MTELAFTIWDINPEPWTSPGVTCGRNKQRGGCYPIVSKSAGLTAYQKAMADEVGSLYKGEPLSGPMNVTFYFWRELAASERASGRKHRRHAADTTNCQKALEDALQGVLYGNDRDTRFIASIMVDQGPNVRPTIHIRVKTLDKWKGAEIYESIRGKPPDEVGPAPLRDLGDDFF